MGETKETAKKDEKPTEEDKNELVRDYISGFIATNFFIFITIK